jgi:hypothetical protein
MYSFDLAEIFYAAVFGSYTSEISLLIIDVNLNMIMMIMMTVLCQNQNSKDPKPLCYFVGLCSVK